MPRHKPVLSDESSPLHDILERERQMEWDVPELRSAQVRLADVVSRLGLSQDVLEKLSFPKRAVVASIPIRMDDGNIKVFAGYLVNHSDTLGPCQGQLRYHPRVNMGEITALAMSNTWKSALIGLPLGGAQGGVRCTPDTMSRKELERITRRYTTEMVPVLGPDRNVLSPGLGTDEQVMAWMMDTYSQMKGVAVRQVVTGKPRIIGGSRGRRDAAGRSAVYAILEASKKIDLKVGVGTKVAIQGFGKLGRAAFRLLERLGCKIVAVNDIRGGVFSSKGLDYRDLVKHMETHQYLINYPNADRIENEELLTLPCDILILAATGSQITHKNAGRVKAKLIAEGANDATSPEADLILRERGVFVLPDILASAGGMIVSYFEWVQGMQSFLWPTREVNQRLRNVIREAFDRAYTLAEREKIDLRTAAMMAGVAKVAEAMTTRGLYP